MIEEGPEGNVHTVRQNGRRRTQKERKDKKDRKQKRIIEYLKANWKEVLAIGIKDDKTEDSLSKSIKNKRQ